MQNKAESKVHVIPKENMRVVADFAKRLMPEVAKFQVQSPAVPQTRAEQCSGDNNKNYYYYYNYKKAKQNMSPRTTHCVCIIHTLAPQLYACLTV